MPTELRGRTEKVGDDLGGESRRRESKGKPTELTTVDGGTTFNSKEQRLLGRWIFGMFEQIGILAQ